MNNQQKAEEYAANLIENRQFNQRYFNWMQDILTEAVLYGIEIGYVNGLKAARHLPGEAYEDDSNIPPIKADWNPKSE